LFSVQQYNDLQVKKLIKEWNIEHNGKKVPVNDQTLDRIPLPLMTALLIKFNEIIEPNAQEQSK
jgi:hypothetical protein